MGLFDNVFATQKRDLTANDAFAGILICAVASDGHICDDEAHGLCNILTRMKLFDNWTDDKFNAMYNRLLGMIKREGVGPVLRRCAQALPEELRETAFANACDLVLADGVVEEEEKAFLDDVQKVLGISGDQALTIVEIMIIKNRG